MNENHELALEDEIKKYKDGRILVKGLVYSYINIRGGIVNESQTEICQKLGISKAAFYKSLHSLEDQKLISWESKEISIVLK